MKKFLSFFLSLTIIITLAGPVQAVSAATIKLNKTNISLTEGTSYTLSVIGTDSSVAWRSSNTSVASITTSGTITAKKAGTATITATVLNKKLSCKVTIKEGFNSKKAVENIGYTVTDIGNGLIMEFKNNYKFSSYMTVDVLYHDTSGTIVGTAESENFYFTTGTACAINVPGPYNSNYENIPYSSYDIKISAKAAPAWMNNMVPYLSAEGSFGNDNLIVTVSNSSKYDLDLVSLSVVFYKSGKPVGIKEIYAEVTANGKDYVQTEFPSDLNYQTIYPDDYKIYINHCYR